MKDARRARVSTLAGVVALAVTASLVVDRALGRREARAGSFAAEAGLRDAVVSPAPPATAGLAGRPVPTSWFKSPSERRVEMDSALLSSRRRRAPVAVQ